MELERVERAKHGGARKGAGFPLGKKKRKTLAKEAAQMYLIRQVEENISELTSALLEKAKSKDVLALKEAFDRAWGKSREKITLTVRQQNPLDEPDENRSLQEDKGSD